MSKAKHKGAAKKKALSGKSNKGSARARAQGTSAAAAAAPTDTERAWDLDALHAELGEPSAELVEMMLAAHTDEDLLELGTSASSTDIVRWAPRFVGLALEQWKGLDAASQRSLIGFSPDVLALIARETVVLRGLLRASGSGGGADARRRAVRVVMSEGVTLRDSVHDALGALVPSKGKLRDAIDAGFGTAASPEELASGLDALATVVRQAREAASRAQREKLEELGLGAALPDALAAKAAELRAAGSKADGGDPTSRITQRKLDLQDGRVLLPLLAAYRAHRNANNRNGAILVPSLGALRGLVSHAKAAVGSAVQAGAPAKPGSVGVS